jgi:ATP-binding cassette subfamily F protein 3
MVIVENITKGFGSQLLFQEVSFKINPREKIGLVGRNGHGKTTLFRLLIGEDPPDSGVINSPKNYRIGYVRQKIEFTKETVLEEGMTGLSEQEKGHYWKAEKILAGLGFSPKDMQRSPMDFSGGFQVRLNLAKVLISEPDLLLLDEPTNYLDITSIRWVERFLSNWPRELMLITHDRSFMDNVVTHILGIHRTKVRKIAGKTEKYYHQMAQEEEVYEKTRIKDVKRRKEIDIFISRFRAKARLANLVQSRIKNLAKMKKNEKLEKLETLDFSFRASPFPGKQVMSVKGVSFSYDENKPLIRNVDIEVAARDRICVVGKNGKGKTTLLKLLAGVLPPQRGKITWSPAVIEGVFEQTHVKNLVDSKTIEEEILYSYPNVDRQLARNICGAMMFKGDDALKKISVLSGGEKSRVLLGKLLVTPINLLLLDEPTNHFDMEACDALLAAIDNFDGTVIMVTHNEMFLHALAEKLIVFQKDGATVFNGSYQDFLDKVGWEEETGIRSVRKKTAKSKSDILSSPSLTGPTKKEIRRRRSQFITERAKVLKPLEKRLSRTEKEIENHESKLNELNSAMLAATQARNGEKIADLSRSIHGCRMAIDRLFDELEAVTTAFEKERAVFEKKFEQLESEIGQDRYG